MRMSALEEMMDKQKLMRMTERSERMYLRARAGGMSVPSRVSAPQEPGAAAMKAGPPPPCGALASTAPAPLLTSPTQQGPRGPPRIRKEVFCKPQGPQGKVHRGAKQAHSGLGRTSEKGLLGGGAGYFRVTGASALGRMGAGQEGTASPPTPWLH